jgi:hypothetical protein
MRQRAFIAVAVIVVAIGGVAILLAVTGSDDAPPTGAVLTWDKPPLVFIPPELPDDRVTYGTVRNTSLEGLQAGTRDFEVRDADGEKLDASVQFLGSYAHGLYGAFQKPHPLPSDELSRLGLHVGLKSGQTSPLTVSYHLAADSKLPATLYYRGNPALDLPTPSDTADTPNPG